MPLQTSGKVDREKKIRLICAIHLALAFLLCTCGVFLLADVADGIIFPVPPIATLLQDIPVLILLLEVTVLWKSDTNRIGFLAFFGLGGAYLGNSDHNDDGFFVLLHSFHDCRCPYNVFLLVFCIFCISWFSSQSWIRKVKDRPVYCFGDECVGTGMLCRAAWHCGILACTKHRILSGWTNGTRISPEETGRTVQKRYPVEGRISSETAGDHQ